jgi:endoglucanase
LFGTWGRKEESFLLTNTLKTLCAIPGVSGREEKVRDYIKDQASYYADSVRVDAMGNLIVYKKGRIPGSKKLMLAAHMDEVGLIIHSVTDEGYLKFYTVGGIDRRVLLWKNLLVGEKAVPGFVGLKAYHLTTVEEGKSIPKMRDLVIDIGATSKEEALAQVSPGDVAVFDTDVLTFGHGNRLLKARAIDDRIGCAIMVELMKEDLPQDVTFVFTVQEEVGTRGAFGAAFSVTPDIALVLEGTTAADLPDMEQRQRVCSPGKGPVVPYMDGGTVYDRELFDLIRSLAEENGIPWQTKEYVSGGTDAGAIQRSREGVRVAAISAAVRYLHTTASVASLTDCAYILNLTRLFLRAVADMKA